ncbi:MAG: glucosamine-6-phosphate deaminase [Bacilli bacterium]|nr:glucosamine-6-phosphate deaminase [Bacilli bacterium]
MKLIIEENEKAMSESAMHILLGAMMQDKRVNISLTSGRSPIELYKMMAPLVKDQDKFKDIEYYLFDEAPWNDKPYGPNWDEMQELFFKDANIPEERIHSLDLNNWDSFDREIERAGGIDVMVIGLGYDGHFCSNAPKCTPLDSYTYLIDREERRKILPRYNSHPEIPYSITMGPKSLMKVKHLVMIVNGKHKAEILKKMLDEPISNELPSTILKLHPNFTVICDKDAASLLNLEDYKRL